MKVVRCVQSRPASTVDSVLHLIAVQNLQYCAGHACFVHNGPPSVKYQYSLSISSLGLSSLWLYSYIDNLYRLGCLGLPIDTQACLMIIPISLLPEPVVVSGQLLQEPEVGLHLPARPHVL